MLAKESSVGAGCGGGPGGSGDVLWRRLVVPRLGELQLLLLCRSRRVSRGAGCCFSLDGNSALASDFLVLLVGALGTELQLCGCRSVSLALGVLTCSESTFASPSSHADRPPFYLSLGGMLAGTVPHSHQLCGMKPLSQWVIQHAGIPGTRVMEDFLLACGEREGTGNSSLTTALAGLLGAVPVAGGFSPRGPGHPSRCLLVGVPVPEVGSPCWGPGLEEELRAPRHLMTGGGDRVRPSQVSHLPPGS